MGVEILFEAMLLSTSTSFSQKHLVESYKKAFDSLTRSNIAYCTPAKIKVTAIIILRNINRCESLNCVSALLTRKKTVAVRSSRS